MKIICPATLLHVFSFSLTMLSICRELQIPVGVTMVRKTKQNGIMTNMMVPRKKEEMATINQIAFLKLETEIHAP